MSIIPELLKPGDTIGIFVPSSPVTRDYRRLGRGILKKMGFQSSEVPGILANHHYLAKDGPEIIRDLKNFFADERISALWAARGGYGSNLLLPGLEKLSIRPKAVIGSSDVSYLLWRLVDRFHLVVYYGPMIYSSMIDYRVNLKQISRLLARGFHQLSVQGKVLNPGTATSLFTGGCLSNLVSVIGTRYFPKIQGRILMLEDVNERPYRLDRMFWQLREAGVFKKISGLVLGKFPRCFLNGAEKKFFLDRIRVYVEPCRGPVLYDLPVGHGDGLVAVPLGVKAKLDAGKVGKITFFQDD